MSRPEPVGSRHSHAGPGARGPRERRWQGARQTTPDPGSGAVVMATGIVSIALALHHRTVLSRALLAITALAWVALALLFARQIARDRAWLRAATRSPASLTAVAATAVLASGLEPLGFHALAAGLLVAATALCAGLGLALVRTPALPRSGSSFMVTVSLQSLAGLTAVIALVERAPWLVYPSLALCALALALYLIAFMRFDPQELVTGAGDQWIAGGALAISALTVTEISSAASRDVALHSLGSPLAQFGAAVWIIALMWLPLLLIAEVATPRLGRHSRRWSTLFPVGMYAASGFEVARTAGLSFAGSFASGWTWVAVALWVLLAAAVSRQAIRWATGRSP